MSRPMLCALLVLSLSAGWAAGDTTTKKTVQELRAAVKQLRAAEKVERKLLVGRYDALIAKLKNPEHNLEEIRAGLRAEEKAALENAQSPDQKKLIRKQYQELTKILGGDIKADKTAIKQVEQQKKTAERLLKDAYAAKIKEMENEIKVLEKLGSGKTKP
ncbi:MAG TPA: hypothetical protein VKU02_15015 [Gemmataceae bacterium]|nr:hypothetical protein [Gemmataceae bacterium]